MTAIHNRYLKLCVLFLATFSFLRVIFFLIFSSQGGDWLWGDILKAFYLGVKFDLRITLLLTLPFLIGEFFYNKVIFYKKNLRTKKNWFSSEGISLRFNKIFSGLSWVSFYTALWGFIFLIYLSDFGYYEYLKDRVNASAFGILQEGFLTSLQMVWESYPVVWGGLGWIFFLYVYWFLLKYIIFKKDSSELRGNFVGSFRKKFLRSFFLMILIFLGLYGKIGYYPLRWSEAFFTSNRFVSFLALNPMHYILDTFKNRQKFYDKSLVRKYYAEVSSYLGVEEPNSETLNFKRIQKPTPLPHLDGKPNIVLIIMESFSAHRTSFFGNLKGVTPEFDLIAEESLVFDQFYTPSEGTARGVFATVASLADINAGRTSSRNPFLVDQNTAINAFKDYDKYYFIGGDASWGNIRGVLESNILGLKLYEEGDYSLPRTDVWGLSDYHVFQGAFDVLKQSAQPFFAVIQSASFHRPYTIPEDSGGFRPLDQGSFSPPDLFKKWGWESLEELNSMRFSDFSLGHFFKLMKSSALYDNTIFVIIGDHGLPDNGSENLTELERQYSIERFHTPLVWHAPKYFKSGRDSRILSQVDLIPTLAAVTGHEYYNTGLGRNMFDPQFQDRQGVLTYIYYRTPHFLNFITPDYLVTGVVGQSQELHDWKNKKSFSGQSDKDIFLKRQEVSKKLWDLANGLYETSKYMLYHNPKL
jgi:phosphoglycerol transferase MdoB-like AlkP superfamily enzyme